MQEFVYEELVVATNNFSKSLLLGKGSHGCVYKGILKEQTKKVLVAIKKQSKGLTKLKDSSKLENEVNILSSLPRCPYIIKLLGTSHDLTNSKLLVMEYMPNDTLHHLLFESHAPPSWHKRVTIALQIARAVQFLHEHLIVHRDLKSTNILFGSDQNAKLADFGLAARYDEVARKPRPAGTIGYMDPCYTTPCKLSTQNDVYSFGVVLLEIISGTKAIDVSRVPTSIVDWSLPLIKKHQIEQICDTRIGLPSNMKELISNLLHMASLCVSLIEDQRPSMSNVAVEIEKSCIESSSLSSCFDILCRISQKIIWKRKNKVATRIGGQKDSNELV